MSETTKADECKKLLDSKWGIVLFKNELGTYAAVALRDGKMAELLGLLDRVDPDPDCEDFRMMMKDGYCITDRWEPSQALYALTEKVFGNIVVTKPESK